MTDHTPANTNPQEELDAQVEPELSLEDQLKVILNEIEEVDPGLMEAQQVIDDDGTPKFIIKPKAEPTPPPAQTEPEPVAESATEPDPTPVSAENIDEDELANLINQAIDEASQASSDTNPTSAPPAIAPTSEEDIARVVDRDIDKAVAQAKPASAKPATHPKVKMFNPADNFIPIEPEELSDAIDEAFETPKPIAEPIAPTPVAQSQPVVQETEPAQAQPPNIAEMPDDARLDNDDLDALFDAMGDQPAAEPATQTPVAESKPVVQETEPAQAQPPNIAEMPDDARLDNDDLDALFDAMGDQPAAEPATQAPVAESKPIVQETTPAQTPPSQPATHPKVKTFNPADNFIPIEPEELSDAIDEAFTTPKPAPQPVAPVPVVESKPAEQNAPAPQAPPPNIADMADDARLNNDDLDALFDAMGDQTPTEPAATAPPSDPLADKADDALLNNDDLDALFSAPPPPEAPEAPEAPEIPQAVASEQGSLEALAEDDLALALDQVLGQAKQEMARLADEKLARQTQLQAQHIQKLKEQAQPETDQTNLDQLLENQPHSVFDDQVFTQQWDQVLDQAREKLSQMAAQKASDTSSDNEKPDKDANEQPNLEQALDSVLGHAVTQLNQLTHEKIKQTAQDEIQQIKSLGQALNKTQDPTPAAGLDDSPLDEAEFADSWDIVLSQAKEELSKIAQAKTTSPLKQHLAEKKQAQESQNSSPTPSDEGDLAAELDALFASADTDSDEPATKPHATPDSDNLSDEELAQHLEGLLDSVAQDAQQTSASQSQEVTADQLQQLVDNDSEASQAPEAIEEAVEQAIEVDAGEADPAVGEPQDPAAMITHIDSLLAEHANDAVSGIFETPEQIANHQSVSEDELEAAFESPEELLQHEDSETNSQTPSTKATSELAAKQAGPDELERAFEVPGELNTADPVKSIQQAKAKPPTSAAVAPQALEADTLAEDVVNPQEATPVEQAISPADSHPTQETPPPQPPVPVTSDTSDQKTKPKSLGLKARLQSCLKTIKQITGFARKQLIHLSPAINKTCSIVNKPLQRLDPQTRNIIGYFGLINMFIGVILFFVTFKNMLFGS